MYPLKKLLVQNERASDALSNKKGVIKMMKYRKNKLEKLLDEVSDYAYKRCITESKLKKSFYTILLYWCKLRRKIIEKWG